MADVLIPKDDKCDDTVLPNEIWTVILQKLNNTRDLANASLVSRQFYALVRPILWYAPEFGTHFFGGDDDDEFDDDDDDDGYNTFELRGLLPTLFEEHVEYIELQRLSDFPIKCLKLSQFRFKEFTIKETVAAIIENLDITSFQIDEYDKGWGPSRLTLEDLCLLFKLPVTLINTNCVDIKREGSFGPRGTIMVEEFVKFMEQYPTEVAIDDSFHSVMSLAEWKLLTRLPLREVNVRFGKNGIDLSEYSNEYLQLASEIQLQRKAPAGSAVVQDGGLNLRKRRSSFNLRYNVSISTLQKFLLCDNIKIDRIDISHFSYGWVAQFVEMLRSHNTFPILSLDIGVETHDYYGHKLDPDELKLLFQFPVSDLHSALLSSDRKNHEQFTNMIIEKWKESPSTFECYIEGCNPWDEMGSLAGQLDDLGVHVLHQVNNYDEDGIYLDSSYMGHAEWRWQQQYYDD